MKLDRVFAREVSKISNGAVKITEEENIMDPKKSDAPGNQPDTTQEYVIELSESNIAAIETEAAEYEKLQKAFIYSIDTDTEKHEITITLLQGHSQLVLPESWVYSLIDQLVNQTRKWHKDQPSC